MPCCVVSCTQNPCGEASEGEIRMRCGVFIVRGVLGFCSGVVYVIINETVPIKFSNNFGVWFCVAGNGELVLHTYVYVYIC